MISKDDPTFFIKSGNTAFGDRQKNIFDLLTLAEKGTNLRSPEVHVDEYLETGITSRKRKRSETKPFKGKESLFKAPEEPPPWRKHNSTPDFQRNPHRWTKYSLADVTEEDISDNTNTQTALSFLKELKVQKSSADDEMVVDCKDGSSSNSLFKFKVPKPVKPQRHSFGEVVPSVEDDCVQHKPVFKSSKLIMPEYVVGDKKGKKSTRNKLELKHDKVKEIRLDHLEEYEDD